MLHRRILDAPRGTTGPDASAHAATTAAYAAVLRALNAQIATLEASVADQLNIHPDAHVVTSLPRSGTVRAARLLAEIGDARGRFPTADSLACLAGVAPSTRQSGKVKAVTFRWSADHQLRDALCDFAGDSRHANPWAADLYQRARARGHDHPHAVRILAPRLGRHHLALLARRRRLQPRPAQRTPTRPQPNPEGRLKREDVDTGQLMRVPSDRCTGGAPGAGLGVRVEAVRNGRGGRSRRRLP